MSRKRSRFPLYAILTVFILPMIIAWVLFHYPGTFHLKSLNHGVLMTPMERAENSLHRWQVVYVTNGHCDESCKFRDYQLHQMKKLLGEKERRVVIDRRDSLLALPTGQIYLMDPQGNIFMSYPQMIDPLAVFKDLKRLLEVSQVG